MVNERRPNTCYGVCIEINRTCLACNESRRGMTPAVRVEAAKLMVESMQFTNSEIYAVLNGGSSNVVYDQFANEYLQDNDEAPQPAKQDRLTEAVADINAYLTHYGFAPLQEVELWEDVWELILAMLRHMEDTLTAPSPTRVQSQHPLYPEERK